MICVYDIGNENYTGNGDAVLQPTEAKVKMVAGGSYDLTMVHPIDPEGKWTHLNPGAVLRVPVPAETIANAYAGMDIDQYLTTGATALREGPSEPNNITYSAWNPNIRYAAGSKVSISNFSHRNYECTYFDAGSGQRFVPPNNSGWWKPVPDKTTGAPAVVSLNAGEPLYFLEESETTGWYKMSTPYGLIGYIRSVAVEFDRHLTPEEVTDRVVTTQLMRITNATADTKNRRVNVNAQHVSYDLNGTIVRDINFQQAAPGMAIGLVMNALMVPWRGTIATDLGNESEVTYTEEIKGKSGMFCLLDPDKGIVNRFDAEFRRDNWDLFIMQKQERDRGFRIVYRKNMLGVSWARKADDLVTRIVPVAKDENGDDLYLPELWIDSAHIGEYPVVKMELLSVKGQVGKEKEEGSSAQWTEETLLEEMRKQAGERFSLDKCDVIVEEIMVDFQTLGDTDEYRELRGLQSVLLYDTVSVCDPAVGLDAKLKVIELEFDAVKGRVDAVKIGNLTQTKTKGKNVAGFNVQSKSISRDKLTDDVADSILKAVTEDIVPDFADPDAKGRQMNTVSTDGYVLAGSGHGNQVWGTDADGNPGWRDESGGGDHGNARVFYATCSTAAATQTKAVTISGLTELVAGDVFNILFVNQQNYNGTPKLKINDLTAYNINRLDATGVIRYEWRVGELVTMVWTGSVFLISDGGTASQTYYGYTKLIESATSTGTLALTPGSLNSFSENTISGVPVYSASSTYALGDRVRYEWNTWECTTAITTAEAWTAAHWQQLPALQDQIDGMQVSHISKTAATSQSLSVPSASQHLVIATTNNASRCYCGIVICATDGTITRADISAGSDVTVSTAANTLTLAISGSARAMAVTDICLSGGFIS